MALILSLETATKSCSVVLAKDGRLLAFEEEVSDKYSHSEQLTVFIERLLNAQNISITDLDAIAVSKGPGSYTGLRIGVSTAKGLCYALNKPLISVNTLRAMADGMLEEYPDMIYCPMIDARRMEVYCCLFKNREQQCEISAKVIDETSFCRVLEQEKVLFFGDGADKCEETITHPNATFIPNIYPSAKNMVRLAEEAFQQNTFEDVAYFEPYYLKDFVAGKKKK